MPDIREVLRGLDKQDAILYSQVRTEMRRAYMAAHAQCLSIAQWSAEDDAFLDLIDIKVAMLFDRSGRFDAASGKPPDIEKAQEIEKSLHAYNDTASQRALANAANGNGGWPQDKAK